MIRHHALACYRHHRASPRLYGQIAYVFGGELTSELKCLTCGRTSRKADPITDVSVSVPQELPEGEKSASIESLLATHFQPELLDGDNRVTCERCGERRDTTKTMHLTASPPCVPTACVRAARSGCCVPCDPCS